MNREPIALYIFRFILGLGLFAFMCMLYWSSVLIENDVQDLKSSLNQTRNDLDGLQSKIQMMQEEILKNLQAGHFAAPSSVEANSKPVEKESPQTSANHARRQMDAKYPNLLQDEPFYKTTLPKMLGHNFKPTGTLEGATIGKPNNLHPFSNWSQTSSWIDLCSVSLSELQFGIYETFTPDMALKIEARPRKDSDQPEYWIHLRDNVFWEPLNQEHFTENIKLASHFLKKHQVTAEDYKFYFDALMNPSVVEPGAVSLRTYLSEIDSIEIVDKLTFIVRWKPIDITTEEGKTLKKVKYVAKQLTGSLRPLASFVYKYFPDGKKIIEEDSEVNTYQTNSVWAQNFMQHWAKNIIPSCGAYLFDGMTEREIRFKRNPDHYKPLSALIENIEDRFKQSPETIWQDFQANKLDSHVLSPGQLKEFSNFLKSAEYRQQEKNGASVQRLDYLSRSYNYIGWNQAKPYFTSKKVRQALTMAIDRNRIINQILNGQGVEITGPFALHSPAYDKAIKPWPFDLQKARQFLEEEGWFDSDADGIIDKEIKGTRIPFEFKLTYYVKNPTTKAICEYVSTALKELNIKCELNGVDMADLSAVFDDKSFDALYLGWALGTPPEDPKQLWDSSGAKEKGSSNAIGFVNAEADQLIKKLQYEDDPEKRVKLYHRFHAILFDEQPYTFLYNLKTSLVYRHRLQNVFIPSENQDLIPGANIAEPINKAFWIKQ